MSSIQDTFIESEYLEGGPGTSMEAVILLESVLSIGSLNQEAHTHSWLPESGIQEMVLRWRHKFRTCQSDT